MKTKGRSLKEEASLPGNRYFTDGYFARSQMDTMVSQIIEVKSKRPTTILEIGIGNGLVSSFLKASGIQVTTFDINENLNPDVIGNILEIEKYFENQSFDLILCAEVLEHLPFSCFEKILEKLANLTSGHLVLTLPRSHRILLDASLSIKIPFLHRVHVSTFIRIPTNQISDDHHWQIDADREWHIKAIKRKISKHFTIEKCFADPRNRPHQFFILNKTHQ